MTRASTANLSEITLTEASGLITDLRDELNAANARAAAATFIQPGTKVVVLLHRAETDHVLKVTNVQFGAEAVVIHASEA